MVSNQRSKVKGPPSARSPRVAIVHDWLVGGGAELVVLELHRMFPDAPIYTSYCTDEWRERLDGKVVTGWLQRWPFSRLYKFLPVLRIWWFTRLKFEGYDLVISSSGNGEAKGIRVGRSKMVDGRWHEKIRSFLALKNSKTPPSTFHLPPSKRQHPVHICYCHSPTHFYWRHYREYMAHPKSGFLNPVARLGLKLLVGPLRRWDYQAAQRPDAIIANSTHIQKDIRKYYDRDSTVIFPPVDTTRFLRPTISDLRSTKRRGFVTVGRQVPYKRIDLVVTACSRLGLPLTVIGRGPEHAQLVKLAGPTITFDTAASDDDVVRYLARANAFVFAGEEDFGITMVEALAAGCPVIAYRAGGALDIVQEGVNGLFFDDQTVESLVEVLQDFPKHQFDSKMIPKTAENFSVETFRERFLEQVAAIR